MPHAALDTKSLDLYFRLEKKSGWKAILVFAQYREDT
jgi:hypothetical protein